MATPFDFIAAPAIASRAFLSLSCISANLSGVWNCLGKDKLVDELSSTMSHTVFPAMLTGDWQKVCEVEEDLAEKANLAAKIRACSAKNPDGCPCSPCPYV